MAVVAAIVDPAPENLGSGVDQTAYEYGGNDWILGEYPSIDIIVNTTLQLGDFAPPTMAATQLDPQPELPLQENPQQEQSSAIHAFFWLTFALLSLPLL